MPPTFLRQQQKAEIVVVISDQTRAPNILSRPKDSGIKKALLYSPRLTPQKP